jgi:hypothetical protein
MAAAGAYAGSWALYLGPDAVNSWDTMRLFLRVVTVAGLYAAGLTLVSLRLRRLVFSFLFVLHFAGISTAALSAPPSPWLVQQVWVRVFRPYLEFMYLNNAYHFYAPEPGPAGYLWFRIIYADPDGVEHGKWYRVPDIDEMGHINHPVPLEYHRYLAMTASVEGYDAQPPWTNALNDFTPTYKERMWLQPHMADNRPLFMKRRRAKDPVIPLHPLMMPQYQVIIPNELSRKLLSTYARHVALKFEKHPEHEDWTFKRVKVYRAIHSIPQVEWFVLGNSPTDPVLYRPYYMGSYDIEGTLKDGDGEDRDPYLYWLLPVLRSSDANSPVLDYCRLHAGDRNWVRPAGSLEWTEPPPPGMCQ